MVLNQAANQALFETRPFRCRTVPRPSEPYVCGAIPASLAESALFGHVRGAFTGADRDRVSPFVEADGGTIFLDELGELPVEVQPIGAWGRLTGGLIRRPLITLIVGILFFGGLAAGTINAPTTGFDPSG